MQKEEPPADAHAGETKDEHAAEAAPKAPAAEKPAPEAPAADSHASETKDEHDEHAEEKPKEGAEAAAGAEAGAGAEGGEEKKAVKLSPKEEAAKAKLGGEAPPKGADTEGAAEERKLTGIYANVA